MADDAREGREQVEPSADGPHLEDLIQAGRLEEARALAEELLTANDEGGAYALLATIHAHMGAFELALGVLDKLASVFPSWRKLAGELTLCTEAEATRANRLSDPEVAIKRAGIAAPPDFAVWQLEATVHHARGEHSAASQFLARAAAEAPALRGRVIRVDGRVVAFQDIVDSDALTGPMLVAIGPRGLLDVPFAELATVELKPLRTYHDLLWPVARLVTLGGEELVVRVPALYAGSGGHALPAVRAGAFTVWERGVGYAVAYGQRELVVDVQGTSDDAKHTSLSIGLHQIARLDFLPTSSAN